MRTMLISTAAIGLVATLMTVPAQAVVCAGRCVTTASVKARVHVECTSSLHA